MSQCRQSRETLYAILQQSQFQARPQQQLRQFMQSLGFQEDVGFAKSLFSERITQIYRETQGQYQQFLAKDSVFKLDQNKRFLLLRIFRKFHEYKLKSKKQQKLNFENLVLPDQNNLQEVIKFQKNMYRMFKSLIPQTNSQNIYSPIIPDPKYASFPIFHDRNFRNFDQQFFPQMVSPFLPNFQHKPFGSFESSHKISSNRSINYNQIYNIQRPSFFSKSSYKEFQKIPSQKDIFSINKSLYEDSCSSPKLHNPFANEDFVSGAPQKKVKRDFSNDNFKPQNLQNMRKQLDFLHKSKSNFLKPAPMEKIFSFQEEGKIKNRTNATNSLKKGLSEPPIQDRKAHAEDND